jgi:hypothetical protein
MAKDGCFETGSKETLIRSIAWKNTYARNAARKNLECDCPSSGQKSMKKQLASMTLPVYCGNTTTTYVLIAGWYLLKGA